MVIYILHHTITSFILTFLCYFQQKLNKYSTAAAPQNQVENDRRKRVKALATGKLTSNRLHQVTGGGAISTEEVQIADEYTQLMADYNAKKKGHVRLEKQFKLQTEGEAILGSVGGKEHVDKIRANAKLTKVLQYGYGEDYKKYVRQPFDKKFASDALISLNTKKAWPAIIEDPGCFDESPTPIPSYGETELAREREKAKQAIMKQALADRNSVIGCMVNNLSDADIRGWIKGLSDIIPASAQTDTEICDAKSPPSSA